MAEKKKIKGSLIAEIIIYSLFGLMAVWGLTYIVLGVLVEGRVVAYDSPLANVNKLFAQNGIGFLAQGLIILAVALLVIVVTLLVAAKSSDREFEKEQRRILARQNRRKGGNQEFVEAEVE